MVRKKESPPERPYCSAVIVAAGSGTRMGGDKLLLELGGATVIERTMLALERCECIDELVVVTQSGKIPQIARLARERGIEKLKCVTEGGANRTESAYRGVCECSERAELIAIHDGARPLVTPELVERAVKSAAERGAAAPAIHVKDTVRQARGGRVLRTLERDELYLMQTPQVFRSELIKAALGDAARLGISLTDDCAAVMLLDAEVFLTEGSEENLKLTTPADVFAASAIIDARGDFL